VFTTPLTCGDQASLTIMIRNSAPWRYAGCAQA
jgi:hypothetical protein